MVRRLRNVHVAATDLTETEMVQIIRKAWTEETLTFDGQYYKVPYPYEEGIRRWPAAEWTRQYGAPGEIDEGGVIRKVCVVPRPYQQPHPPLFQPFSVSETTIRYTAQSGIVPWILVAHPPEFRRLCEVYQQVGREAGRNLKLVQGIGAFRAVHFGQEAVRQSTSYGTPTTPASKPTSAASASGRRSALRKTPRSTRSIPTPRCRSRSGPSTGCAR